MSNAFEAIITKLRNRMYTVFANGSALRARIKVEFGASYIVLKLSSSYNVPNDTRGRWRSVTYEVGGCFLTPRQYTDAAFALRVYFKERGYPCSDTINNPASLPLATYLTLIGLSKRPAVVPEVLQAIPDGLLNGFIAEALTAIPLAESNRVKTALGVTTYGVCISDANEVRINATYVDDKTIQFEVDYGVFMREALRIMDENGLTEPARRFDMRDTINKLAALAFVPAKSLALSAWTNADSESLETVNYRYRRFTARKYFVHVANETREVKILRRTQRRDGVEHILTISGHEFDELQETTNRTYNALILAGSHRQLTRYKVLCSFVSQYLPEFRDDGKNHPYVEALAEEEKLRDIITGRRQLGYEESTKEAERTLAFLVASRMIHLIKKRNRIAIGNSGYMHGATVPYIAEAYPNYADCVPVAESKKVLDEIALAARMADNAPMFNEEWNNTIRYLCTVLPEEYEEPVDLQRIYDNFVQDQQILFADDLQ